MDFIYLILLIVEPGFFFFFVVVVRFTWNISEMFRLLNVTKVRMKVKITHSNTNAFSDHCHNQNMFPGAV